MVSRLAGN
jgi:hypothetical protein